MTILPDNILRRMSPALPSDARSAGRTADECAQIDREGLEFLEILTARYRADHRNTNNPAGAPAPADQGGGR